MKNNRWCVPDTQS